MALRLWVRLTDVRSDVISVDRHSGAYRPAATTPTASREQNPYILGLIQYILWKFILFICVLLFIIALHLNVLKYFSNDFPILFAA
jgi:hypothetical protein